MARDVMTDEQLAEIRELLDAELRLHRLSAGSYPVSGHKRMLLAEVERLRARERPLLVLLRAVASGEPLPEVFVWQARGWLQAEVEQEGRGGV